MTEPWNAPGIEGPGGYSHAVTHGGLHFLSGQVGVTAAGEVVPGGCGPQTTQAIANVTRVLEHAGGALADVLAVTVHLRDAEDFAAFDAAYRGAMGDHRPARTTVVAALLDAELSVEITVVARARTS